MKYLAMNKANEHSDLGMEGVGGGGGGGSISHWKPPLPKVIHLKKKTTAITEARSFPTGDKLWHWKWKCCRVELVFTGSLKLP